MESNERGAKLKASSRQRPTLSQERGLTVTVRYVKNKFEPRSLKHSIELRLLSIVENRRKVFYT